MRRKQLKIIFLSVLMIAATPRVMSNFNSYTDALYHKAEAEWLNFLLSFAYAEENNKNTATPKQAQETPPCTSREVKAAQPFTVKPAVATKKNSRSFKSRNRSFDFAWTVGPSMFSDVKKEAAGGDVQLERAVRRHVSRMIAQPDDPAAIDRNGRAKTEYMRILIRSLRLGDSKTLRTLKREVAAVAWPKTWSLVSEPVDCDKDVALTLEAQPDVADGVTSIDQDSSDNSTLDAY